MILAQKVKELVADPVESLALQVPRALIASIFALAVDFSLLELCVRMLGMPALPAAVVGYLAGTMLQFVLCSVWVFAGSSSAEVGGFVAFALLSVIGLGITWIAMFIAHQWAGAPLEVAKAGAVGLAFAWNFLSRKYLLFRA